MARPEQWLRATLEAASGCRVFPVIAPENSLPPFVIYQRTLTTRERITTENVCVPVATFAVWIHADTYLEGKDLADRVRLGVDNFKGVTQTVTIERAFLTDESDGEPVDFAGEGKPTYTVQLQFEIRYRED
jgi:hypothetical protein